MINGQVFPYTKDSTIFLSDNDKSLIIELNPVEGNAIKYCYRIAELNKDWLWSNYPSIHFYDFSGGDYLLQIQAKADTRELANLDVRIKKMEAFWQKWWFWPSIAVYILLVVGVGFYLFFIYDVRQKLKLQHVRNQIASDLHDEVGSNLNSIAIFVELLRKKVVTEKPELLPILDKITDNSEETVLLMRDTVWAINPDNDSTEKLFEKMHSFGVEILSAKGIPFNFEPLVDLKKDLFSMEQRRNIYLVFKEAVNNISKHSSATEASCKIFQHQGLIKISIKDNGKGFDFNQTFEGNGLKNFKLRSQQDDLKVFVNSYQQKGTEILIEILF
ncbi:hypothetical protein GCM10027442_43210 [Emticicia fontis]